MANFLLERLGLGNDRAVANARRAQVDREREDWLVAGLIRTMQVREALVEVEHRSRSAAA